MIVNMSVTICITNNESETNAIRSRHACKKIFTCPGLFHCG